MGQVIQNVFQPVPASKFYIILRRIIERKNGVLKKIHCMKLSEWGSIRDGRNAPRLARWMMEANSSHEHWCDGPPSPGEAGELSSRSSKPESEDWFLHSRVCWLSGIDTEMEVWEIYCTSNYVKTGRRKARVWEEVSGKYLQRVGRHL